MTAPLRRRRLFIVAAIFVAANPFGWAINPDPLTGADNCYGPN